MLEDYVALRIKLRRVHPLLRSLGIVTVLLTTITGLYLLITVHRRADTRPNIVLVLADDLGYNDLGYVRSPDEEEIRTPFIDRLARHALNLEHAYVQPICSASRAALLTGRYPFRYGYQRTALTYDEMTGLEDRTFPQRLQELGYRTHLVGKWHLGHCKDEYTPLYKGFDTFRGYLGGNEGYYTHRAEKLYHDYRLNDEMVYNHEYSTLDYARYTEDLILNSTGPMFLYLAMQAPHMPYDPPPGVDEDADKDFRYRKIVETIDVYVERVHRALTLRGLIDNTVFIFGSDNGASIHGGSNYPLRGLKQDLFDGATRVRSFLFGPGIPAGSFQGLFHITDWFPTLLHLAGDPQTVDTRIDGVDQLEALRHNYLDHDKHPRKSFIYDISQKETRNGTIHSGAVRLRTRDEKGYLHDYKLILGLPGPSEPHLVSREGLLFDMDRDERETRNIRGNQHVRDLLRYVLEEEKSRGYRKRDPVFNDEAYTVRDIRTGRPIIGTGWC